MEDPVEERNTGNSSNRGTHSESRRVPTINPVRSDTDQQQPFERIIKIIETPKSNCGLTSELSYVEEIPDGKDKRCLQNWHLVFIISCVVALLIDPIFCYILVIDGEKECLDLDTKLANVAIVLRSFTDTIHVIHIGVRFKYGFLAGYQDSKRAKINLLASLLIDVLAILPVPQVILLAVIPRIQYSGLFEATMSMKFAILLQYVSRIYRICPLYEKVTLTSHRGRTALWAKTTFNLFLYILASHVLGAFWYLFAVERKATCWLKAYKGVRVKILHCKDNIQDIEVLKFCSVDIPNKSGFNFGMFQGALQADICKASNPWRRIVHSFLWGLQNLSSLGQNLETSPYLWENCFAVLVSISGLILFAYLIGNMKIYLQFRTHTLEKMKQKGEKIELWMAFHSLPRDLKTKIRRYQSYVWEESKGLEVENLLHSLPRDLRRNTKRYLCKDLLMKVPVLKDMKNGQLLEEIYDHLKPMIYMEKTYIIREGDLIDEMLFITRGQLWTYSTNGGSRNPRDTDSLRKGDFYGEELVEWALESHSPSSLPFSTKTVKAHTEVETFVLTAHDLAKIVTKYGRFFNRVNLKPRAAYIIQKAWRTWRCYNEKKQKAKINQTDEETVNLPSTSTNVSIEKKKH